MNCEFCKNNLDLINACPDNESRLWYMAIQTTESQTIHGIKNEATSRMIHKKDGITYVAIFGWRYAMTTISDKNNRTNSIDRIDLIISFQGQIGFLLNQAFYNKEGVFFGNNIVSISIIRCPTQNQKELVPDREEIFENTQFICKGENGGSLLSNGYIHLTVDGKESKVFSDGQDGKKHIQIAGAKSRIKPSESYRPGKYISFS